MAVRYTVPCRVHGTLLNMGLNSLFVDGGFGFSLEHPRLVFEAHKQNNVCFENLRENGLETDLVAAVEQAIKTIKEKYLLNGDVSVTFEETIPSHRGFGSKTATVLSVAHAYCSLYGVNADYRNLAVMLGRGGTSGIGSNIINKGGFIIDYGHFRTQKDSYLPSSASKGIGVPNILYHCVMPDENVIVVVPQVEKKINGDIESNFFQRVCPVNDNDIGRTIYNLFLVWKGIERHDLDIFYDGINAMQECGWKKSEIAEYGDIVFDLIKYMREIGMAAVGMSSIGPAIYAFGKKELMVQIKTECEDNHSVYITKPNNIGVKVESV